MSEFWIVMLSVGILTFLIRLSFVFLLENWQPPNIVKRGLRFAPVAVLTSIFVAEITLVDGSVALSMENLRLIAGIIAILIAWRSKSALWTIAVGMTAFWLLTWIL